MLREYIWILWLIYTLYYSPVHIYDFLYTGQQRDWFWLVDAEFKDEGQAHLTQDVTLPPLYMTSFYVTHISRWCENLDGDVRRVRRRSHPNSSDLMARLTSGSAEDKVHRQLWDLSGKSARACLHALAPAGSNRLVATCDESIASSWHKARGYYSYYMLL